MSREYQDSLSHPLHDAEFHLNGAPFQGKPNLFAVPQPQPSRIFRLHEQAGRHFQFLQVGRMGRQLFGPEGPLGK